MNPLTVFMTRPQKPTTLGFMHCASLAEWGIQGFSATSLVALCGAWLVQGGYEPLANVVNNH